MNKMKKIIRGTLGKTPSKASKFASRLKRIAKQQTVYDVVFETEASAATASLEETISSLFGTFGLGKTTFAAELGFALQKKYHLSQSGVYFIQCAKINHSLNIRKTMIPTWPTFRAFVDKMESSPELVKTVKMWCIDDIDSLAPLGISTICHDMGITDLREGTRSVGGNGWFAEAWQELRFELEYQILRLASLGPGVLILSHERGRKRTEHNKEVEKATMDLSNSIYNSIGNMCSMVLRMKVMSDVSRKAKSRPIRCLSFLDNETEEVKDNLCVMLKNYPEGIMKFGTEREAVDNLLGCFGRKIKSHKKVAKKSKKVVRKNR
jgi:hypothetical protein